MTTDETALLRDLDEGRWLTLRAMADLAESEGRDAEAAGWRWLAERKKMPQCAGWSSPSYAWMPLQSLDSSYRCGLPCGLAVREYASEAAAYVAAAKAVGEWLAAEGKP